MKTFIASLVCFFILSTGYDQTIEPCSGNNSSSNLSEQDMRYFRLQGIDINKYNWSDFDVNCHINLMVDAHHAAKSNAVWGGVSLGLGSLFFPASMYTIAWIADVGFDSTGLPATIIICTLDAALIYGGIALFKRSIYKKQEMSFQRNEVAKYYRRNNLFKS